MLCVLLPHQKNLVEKYLYTYNVIKFLIFYFTGISSTIASKLGGGSFISKVLLANADALCAAASPLMEEEIPLYVYWYYVLPVPIA